MSPLAVITAILFGSSVAISFGLIGVWVIFAVLRGSSEQIQSEMQRLPLYCVALVLMSVASGAALYSLLKKLPWAWRAQAGMWLALVALCALAWPR